MTKNESREQSVVYSGEEAVLLLQDWFFNKARRFCRKNRDLIEDLAQEMSVGVLQCRGMHTLSFFKRRSWLRACNFVRNEKRAKGRLERYALLRQETSRDDDTPFIEGLVDLENQISSRAEGGDGIIELYGDTRVCA